MTVGDFTALDGAGLNLQAVFNLDELPADVAAELRCHVNPARRYRQLILIGHAGKTLWDRIKASGISSENPIDDFSVQTVVQWFSAHFPTHAHEVVYPGNIPVGLQTLGKIAGWHHASPLMIGIQEKWGTWFAYRALLLTNTDLEPSRPRPGESPCTHCQGKACIASCPSGALDGGAFDLDKCISYRKAPSSRCTATCIARTRCPVGVGHRYCEEQIAHTYSVSMKAIERHY